MSIKLLDGSSFGHRRPFGIRAVVVREIRFKVDYSISTGLEDFGITTSGSRKELEEFIGDSPQLATESLLKGRGETKHVPVKTGRIRSTSSIELLGRGTIGTKMLMLKLLSSCTSINWDEKPRNQHKLLRRSFFSVWICIEHLL